MTDATHKTRYPLHLTISALFITLVVILGGVLSWQNNRKPPAPLPVTEKLLDDKPHHLIERHAVDRLPADNPWGFRVDTPEYKYNRGELKRQGAGSDRG